MIDNYGTQYLYFHRIGKTLQTFLHLSFYVILFSLEYFIHSTFNFISNSSHNTRRKVVEKVSQITTYVLIVFRSKVWKQFP